jgi:hypothetical protein
MSHKPAKNKIIFNFVKFEATIKVEQQIRFPLLFVAVVGSGMDKNQDPVSGIIIPHPEHILRTRYRYFF